MNAAPQQTRAQDLLPAGNCRLVPTVLGGYPLYYHHHPKGGGVMAEPWAMPIKHAGLQEATQTEHP